MSYEIIAMGDAELLRQAFEGVALIAGGDSFAAMIKIGVVAGILFGVFNAVITGKLDLMPAITGFLVYSIMFGPKTDIWIVDPFGSVPRIYCMEAGNPGSATPSGIKLDCEDWNEAGAVLKVDNVPIGIAAPMYIISQFATSVSEKFTQAFSAPDMYSKSDGYLNALNILSKFRNYDGGSTQASDQELTHFRRAFVYYVNQCVQRRVDAGFSSWGAILNAPISSWFDLNALGSNNVNIDTMPLTESELGNTEWPSCANVSDALRQGFTVGSPLAEKLESHLPSSNVVTTKGALSTAVRDILKSGSIDPQNFMMAAFARTALLCAKEGVNSENCITVTQAQQQRNQQWAAEQTLFKQVARPLMSFIEMFVVAATPLMAFLVATGIGAKLAVKYLQLIGWIALWPVTMTLCNIYIYNMASREMLARAAGNTMAFSTIGGLESVFTTSSDWVATGGLLAASVPMLTFFLVTGSAQAFQSLAGRLQGGDHINEKISTPDLVSPAGISQAQSRFTFNPNMGGIKTGMESGLDRFQIGATAQSGLANSRSAVTEASNALQQTYGTDLQSGIQKLHSDSNTKAWMKTAEQSMTKTQQVALQTARENLIKAVGSDRDANALMEKGAVKASLGFRAFGMGAGAELSAETTKGKTSEQMKAIEDAWRQSSSTIDSTAHAYRTALTSQSGRNVMDSLTNTIGESKRAGFNEATGRLLRASEQVQESESRAASLGASGDRDVRTWASQIANAGLGQKVWGSAGALGLEKQAALNAKIYHDLGMDKGLAQIAGAGMALQNAGLAGNAAALNAINTFHSSVSGVNPDVKTPTNGLGDSHYSGTMKQGEDAVAAVTPKVAGVPGAVAAADSLMPDTVTPAPTAASSPVSKNPLTPTKKTGANKPAIKTATVAPPNAQKAAGKLESPSTPKVNPENYPAGYVPPSTTAPSPDGLVSDQQRQFLKDAKDKQKPSAEDFREIAGQIPAMTGAIKSGAVAAAGDAVDWAKEHPAEVAEIAAEVAMVASSFTAIGAARAAGSVVMKQAGEKLIARVTAKHGADGGKFAKEFWSKVTGAKIPKPTSSGPTKVTPSPGRGPNTDMPRSTRTTGQGPVVDAESRIVPEAVDASRQISSTRLLNNR